MKGATALDCANTISRPNAMKMTTIGTIQNFFSCRRNWKNSDMTRLFFMMTSKHALEMRPIAIARRIRRPPFELVPAPRQRILADQAPQQRHRHQQQREHQRQQNSGVDVPEHTGEFPPGRARPFEQARLYQAEEQQHAADSP